MKTLYTLLLILIASASSGQNLNLRSKLAYPFDLSNLWGYADSLGNEYALVGTQMGLSVINVTNPDSIFEVDTMEGTPSTWREIRTWQNYAYVTTEGSNWSSTADGLTIVDLSYLPDSITYKRWHGDGAISGMLNKIHALHIEDGYAYLYGSSISGMDGAIIVSLADPWNPQYISHYSSMGYIHDGIVRNDTLYAGHILDGYFSVVDVTDKANPVALQTQNTPSNFTHNTWLTGNSRVLLTTDEKPNSYLTSYDITDLNNIEELDRVQLNPGSNAVVHNTYILNDYAVTSWYTEGLAIVDANRPQNLVVVGHFDTYPFSSDSMNGCWGVYPYLPSGNIIASDIQEGLFVLTPSYVRACYLEGTVTDSLCGTPMNNVTVQINTTALSEKTDFYGIFKMGTPVAGTYDITFSATGYNSKTVTGVNLSAAAVTNLAVQLYSSLSVPVSGTVSDTTDAGIGSAQVAVYNAVSGYNFTSDVSGNFSRCDVLSDNDYTVIAGKWGYITQCSDSNVIDDQNNSLNINLKKGYYDDFSLYSAWTVSGNAAKGRWERGEPAGTFNNGKASNPGADVTADCSDKAYVTGNAGGNVWDDDVDDGNTILTSPAFDLSSYSNPYIHYYRWFYNAGGSGSPNDSLIVRLNNGTTEAKVETVTAGSPGNSTWVRKSIKVADHITPTANMKISFETMDAGAGHLVEAGVDKFEITEGMVSIKEENTVSLKAYPNPFTGHVVVSYDISGTAGSAVITLTDVAGRIIKSYPVQNNSNNLLIDENIASGVYFLCINAGDEKKVIKLVRL